MRTSTPGHGRPTLPGRSSHSAIEMRVAPPSLIPYSSAISHGASASMMRRFTGTGHGAPACTMSCSDEWSRAASSSGTSSRRMKCAGTMNVRVTRWRSTSRSHSRRVERRKDHRRRADEQRGHGPAARAGVVRRAGHDVDVVRRPAPQRDLAHRDPLRDLGIDRPGAVHDTLRPPRRARRVEDRALEAEQLEGLVGGGRALGGDRGLVLESGREQPAALGLVQGRLEVLGEGRGRRRSATRPSRARM